MSNHIEGRRLKRDVSLNVRLNVVEMEGLQDAVALADLPLSVWVRNRIRAAIVRELTEAGRPVAFLESRP